MMVKFSSFTHRDAHDFLDNTEILIMIPVSQEHWTNINIIIVILGAVNDQSCLNVSFLIASENHCMTHVQGSLPHTEQNNGSGTR